MDVMSIQPLIHSLYLWYYPSHMEDVYSDFETAGCGYAEHLDTFKPTKGFKHTLEKCENQRADEGMFLFGPILVTIYDASSDGCRAKKVKCIAAKMPGNSQELQ